MISIDGSAIPTPSTFQCGIMDGSKSERSGNFDMIMKYLKSKRKLEMTWAYMSSSDYSALLVLVTLRNFSCTYPDPYTGALRTGTFYAGDRVAEALDYKSGVIRWKNIKMNFIEI